MKSKIKFVIMGNPATKKNSMQIFKDKKTGKPFITQSERYKKYADQFKWQVPPQVKLNISCEVNVKCLYYRKTRHKVDLTNLMACTHDLLKEAGVLEDDNCNIIVSVDGSRVYYDKDCPRVEIEIEEA